MPFPKEKKTRKVSLIQKTKSPFLLEVKSNSEHIMISFNHTCYWHKTMDWCLDHLGIIVLEYVKKEITFVFEKVLCLWFLVRLKFLSSISHYYFFYCLFRVVCSFSYRITVFLINNNSSEIHDFIFLEFSPTCF